MPPEYVGAVLKLCNDKRGVQKKMLYVATQVSLQYELPLAEVVLDFFDRLKSVSRGYASFDYESRALPGRAAREGGHPHQRRQARCAGDHRPPRERLHRGRELVEKMQELIPRQMFEVAVQAADRLPTSLRARPSKRCARTCSPSAMAATSRARESCSRSKKKARSA